MVELAFENVILDQRQVNLWKTIDLRVASQEIAENRMLLPENQEKIVAVALNLNGKLNGNLSHDNARKKKASRRRQNRQIAQAIGNRASHLNSVLQRAIRPVLAKKVLLVPIRGALLALTKVVLREKATPTTAQAAVRQVGEAPLILQENVLRGAREMDETKILSPRLKARTFYFNSMEFAHRHRILVPTLVANLGLHWKKPIP